MIDDLLSTFGFLTILPLSPRGDALAAQPGRMYAYFPLVGLLIGVLVGLVGLIRFLPPDLVALLALVVWVGLTGGLHLDGLADSCDGLLSTAPPERRREIMKDPRAGSWAVVGVCLILLGKWIALRGMSPVLILIPPVAGRWAMALAAARFPRASASGLAAQLGVGLGRAQVIAASATAILIMGGLSVFFGWGLMALAVVPPLMALGLGSWAARQLGGGLTGDVYGALCELVELICLVCLNIR